MTIFVYTSFSNVNQKCICQVIKRTYDLNNIHDISGKEI